MRSSWAHCALRCALIVVFCLQVAGHFAEGGLNRGPSTGQEQQRQDPGSLFPSFLRRDLRSETFLKDAIKDQCPGTVQKIHPDSMAESALGAVQMWTTEEETLDALDDFLAASDADGQARAVLYHFGGFWAPVMIGFVLLAIISPCFCCVLTVCRDFFCGCFPCAKPGRRWSPLQTLASGTEGIPKCRMWVMMGVLGFAFLGILLSALLGFIGIARVRQGALGTQCGFLSFADEAIGGAYSNMTSVGDRETELFWMGLEPAGDVLEQVDNVLSPGTKDNKETDRTLKRTEKWAGNYIDLVYLMGNLTEKLIAGTIESTADLGGTTYSSITDRKSYHACVFCRRNAVGAAELLTQLLSDPMPTMYAVRTIANNTLGSSGSERENLQSIVETSRGQVDNFRGQVAEYASGVRDARGQVEIGTTAYTAFYVLLLFAPVLLVGLACLELVIRFRNRGVPLKVADKGYRFATRTCSACMLWLGFLTVSILLFVFGGLFVPFWILLGQGCEYAVNVEERVSEWVGGRIADKVTTGILGDALQICLSDEGSRNLTSLFGVDLSQFQQSEYLESAIDNLTLAWEQDKGFLSMDKYDNLHGEAVRTGPLFLVDRQTLPSDVTDITDYPFNAIWWSGIQDEDIDISFDQGILSEYAQVGGGTVLGLATLESGALDPFRFQDRYTATQTYPISVTAPFSDGEWTSSYPATITAAATAKGYSDSQTDQFARALWIAQRKAMLRASQGVPLRCPSQAPECAFQNHTGNPDNTVSYWYNGTSSSYITSHMLYIRNTAWNVSDTEKDALKHITFRLGKTLTEFVADANRYLFNSFCGEFFSGGLVVSVTAIVTAFLCIACFGVFYAIYRFLRDSRELEWVKVNGPRKPWVLPMRNWKNPFDFARIYIG
uniref:Uncharacterized protein n=1 Tax=Chromera velia CCMP2878 TaxID=1169474 RepID=A0A0G4FAM3_9ALVE|eukprot:Cvel_15927.t1-p1 / transcript=Cvel_15927.t1 / gene=Cvel_15927 / organism=Chromera_velia_CCMP2878 / gene_product=hypothetical protein / transcript_product=hypothetical protein / location=Cvel_scaffold1204:36899-43825(+) / protein_length=892 / sequence_SO=supercontig / SO=protein_coding / is_pseudo=false